MADFEEFRPEVLLGPLNDVEQKNAPATLYLAGDPVLLQKGKRVSVVGSRNATPAGQRRTADLAAALVQQGITVVSGLARGIDTVAHETAIKRGGRTIAVLGTPIDRVYPRENATLQKRIINEHLAASQFAPGTGGGRSRFPMRNRTMALLTDATVIVEAGEWSGTIHQGWEAIRLGRPLFLLESLVHNIELSWPRQLIDYGAQVLTKGELSFVLAELPERSPRESLTL